MRYWWHWALLILVVLLVFGAGRLPDIAKSVAQSLKVFKKEIKDIADDAAPSQPTKDEPANGDTPPKA